MSGQAGRSLAGSQETAATDAIGDIEEPIVEAIQVIEAFLGSSSMSLRVKDAWKRVRNAAERPANARGEVAGQGKVLEQVARDVRKTLRIVEQRSTPPARAQSYADAVKALAPAKEAAVPFRQRREIIVSSSGETPDQRRRDNKELVEDINKGVKEAGGKGGVVAARRLPSGDIAVTTEDEDTRHRLEKDRDWLQAVGEGAQVRRRTYVVLAHGIRVSSVDTETAIKSIYTQNPKLVGHVEILAIRWAKKGLRAGKTKAPLHLCIAEPDQANVLIDQGLIWQYQLHRCEPFAGECQVTQCYKCHQYNHTAKMCGNTAKCGFCAAPGHETNSCPFRHEPARHRCTVCAKPGARHTAWAPMCPERKKRVEQARQSFLQRPVRFQSLNSLDKRPTLTHRITTEQTATPDTQLAFSQNTTLNEAEDILSSQVEQERASEIDSSPESRSSPAKTARITRQTRRAAGRPRWNSTAPERSQDIRELIAGETPTPSQ